MLPEIDLHTHTTASDGTFTPAELVAAAVDAGLSAVAVTDHDVTFGAAEAIAVAAVAGATIEVVPGVEISADWPRGQMHMLGLFIDPGEPELVRWLSEILGGRDARNLRIVERLRELGVDIELAEVEAVAGEGAVGRPHIARVLVDKGAVADLRAAFDRFLGRGAAAYFDRLRATPEVAIERIHAAGGLAVLAHPHHCGAADEAELTRWVGELVEAGLDGIEVRYATFRAAEQAVAERLRRRFDLLPSGGSDFHGGNKPDIRIGRGRGDLAVPRAFLDQMKEALARRPAAAASTP